MYVPRSICSSESAPANVSRFCCATEMWNASRVNVSHPLGGKYIGLEHIAPDIWAVIFGPASLRWLHIDKGAIIDDNGSSSRNPKL